MKKNSFVQLLVPLAIFGLFFFGTGCNLFKEQPSQLHENENPTGVIEAFHQKVVEAGSANLEVIGIDDQAWESDVIYTGPVEKRETPVTNRDGDIVYYRTEFVFTTKVKCLGGCQIMKVRATFEDTTSANLLIAAVANAAESGKVFVLDWTVTNKTVNVGDKIDCVFIPVSSTPTSTEVYYMLYSASEPRPLPPPPAKKEVPAQKYRRPAGREPGWGKQNP